MKKLKVAFRGRTILMDEYKRVILLGRNIQNDLIVEGDCVSRYHLRLEQKNENYFLMDESQNGTYLYNESKELIQFVHRNHFTLTESGFLSLGKPATECAEEDLVKFSLIWADQLVNDTSTEELSPGDPTIAILTTKSNEFSGINFDDLNLVLEYLLREQEQVFILLDENLFVRYYTKRFGVVVNKPLQDMMGKDVLSLIHRDERQSFFDLCYQSMLQQNCLQGRFRMATLEPKWSVYHIRILPNQKLGLGWNGVMIIGAAEGSMGERNNYLDHRYELKIQLQSSNFASTYLGVDHGRPGSPDCIIKELKLNVYDDIKTIQTCRRLFNSEAITLEKLGRHDRIPLLLGYFEKDSSYYLVQDYIQGKKLSKVLEENTWQEVDVVNFLKQMLEILNYVHSQNVIHRDIKPDNIIKRDLDGAYVLIDFGSVKLIPATVASEARPQSQPLTVPVGTPGYMALEQKLGKPVFSSDLYSLGVIAIEAIVRKPFEEIKRDWPKEAQCSQKLKDVLIKMVQDKTTERWQSAQEAYNALL